MCRGGWSEPALLPKHPARGGELGAAAVNTAKRPSQVKFMSFSYQIFNSFNFMYIVYYLYYEESFQVSKSPKCSIIPDSMTKRLLVTALLLAALGVGFHLVPALIRKPDETEKPRSLRDLTDRK